MARVIFLTDFSEAYARELLLGMARYAHDTAQAWSLCRLPLSIRDKFGIEAVVEWAVRMKADAVIGQFYNTDNVGLFRENGIIAIAQDFKKRFTTIPNITGPHHLAGRMAAEYFLKKGFRNFAFYGTRGIDFSDERLRRARELGATVTVNPGRDEVLARLAEAHGASEVYGIPVVASNVYIEATGATAAFEEIVRIAPVGARVVVVSVHKKPAPLDLQFVLMKELTIKGSIGYPREFPEVIEMLKDSRVDVAPLISHRFALADFMEALKTARDPDSSAKVMITFDAWIRPAGAGPTEWLR